MEVSATFNYSSKSAKCAVFAFWRRRNLDKRELILSVLLLIGLGGLAYLRRAEGGGWGIALLTLWIFSFWLVRVGSFFWLRQNKLRALRLLDDGTVRVRVHDNGIDFNSANGESRMGWTDVKELWQLPDLWLIVWSDFQFSYLPVGQIPDAMKSIILANVTIPSTRRSGA